MAAPSSPPAQADLTGRAWYLVPRPVFTGDNEVTLLHGGDEMFPAMCSAIAKARKTVVLATYIFYTDPAALRVLSALESAARRGVDVRVVIDGFGSKAQLSLLMQRLTAAGVSATVFRPLDRWTQWFQPGQLRRLHMKLCVVDSAMGYIGGINIIDDRFDLRHGPSDRPRLDFAAAVYGPAAAAMDQAARAVWSRAQYGRDWHQELQTLLRTAQPLQHLRGLLQQVRLTRRHEEPTGPLNPVRASLVVRDNLRQRRTIERTYISAIRRARKRVWLMSPYFYPAPEFRLALRKAAQRGVDVRLLLQGKIDYRLAGMAARVLYEDLMRDGVKIYEYTPAFLHAKIALVDHDWSTVGSSNIDPISLLLNLEANLIVRDEAFNTSLAMAFESAQTESHLITVDEARQRGWGGWLRRATVAWVAYLYLRIAGVTGRY